MWADLCIISSLDVPIRKSRVAGNIYGKRVVVMMFIALSAVPVPTVEIVFAVPVVRAYGDPKSRLDVRKFFFRMNIKKPNVPWI